MADRPHAGGNSPQAAGLCSASLANLHGIQLATCTWPPPWYGRDTAQRQSLIRLVRSPRLRWKNESQALSACGGVSKRISPICMRACPLWGAEPRQSSHAFADHVQAEAEAELQRPLA